MNENIKDILKLINEHPDLPVVPMGGQGIVADCTDEWIANFGKAEIRKICMYEESIIFYDENTLKTAQTLDFYLFNTELWDSLSDERANRITKEMIDSLDWLEVIIVHIETPTVNIPDNTETINELWDD